MKRQALELLNSPIVCLLIVMIILSIFTVSMLSPSNYNSSSFVTAGDHYCNSDEVNSNLIVLKNSDGYDGQFYYRFALNPFTSRGTEFGVTIDNPAFRQQRFFYPFFVYLISFGNPNLVPIVMIGTNFVFFCLLGWISGKFAQTLNQHALWGLLIVFYPGFLFTYSRDLVEIVEATLILSSILLLRYNKSVWATVLLTLAVFTKETSLIVPVAAAIVYITNWLRGKKETGFGWYYFIVPIIAFCSLQFALFLKWGRFPVSSAGEGGVFSNFPLAAFTSFLIKMLPMQDTFQRSQTVALIFLVLFTLGILYHLLITKALPYEILSCLIYGVLIASVGTLVWAEDVAFLRAYTQFYVFGAIVILASKLNPVKIFLLSSTSAIWLFEFMRIGFPDFFFRLTSGWF